MTDPSDETAAAWHRPAPPRGRLVLHGGGRVDPGLRPRLLATVGGATARVLVVPQASAFPENGQAVAEAWRDAGAGSVELLDIADVAGAVRQIERADFVWLTAGDQSRLVAALAATPVAEALHHRYHAGLVVGGVSAGMAALSAVMITGEPADPETGATHVSPGLGLWPEVILDQHLLARDRLGRLMRAVADHPGLVGIGVDEATAVFVDEGRRIVVDGHSQAVVVRWRGGGVEATPLVPGASHVLDEPAAPPPDGLARS
jgi:cyanophycinase